MQIIHHITMDMVRPRPMLSLDAVQGDGNTRQILLELLENGKSWEVPADVSAAVAFRKEDGTRGLYDTLPDGTKAVTISGNTVAAVLAPQALSCAGEVSATVVFHDGKLNQLAAFPFSIWVKENPAAGQALSNDYYAYSTMKEVGAAVDAALASLETEKQAFLAKAQEALRIVHDTATEDAPAIVCEASGESITVADATDRPLKGLTICGKTLQNGTPTPENPVPLESVGAGGSICVTVAGKNLYSGGDLSFQKAQVITLDKPLPAGTYMLSAFVTSTDTDDTASVVTFVNGKGVGANENVVLQRNERSSEVVTLAADVTQIRFNAGASFGTSEGDTATFTKIQIEPGSIATEYEPYKGQTLTASTPGGLHGIGDVKDEIDFARGVRVQRIVRTIFDGDENWYEYGFEDSSFCLEVAPLGYGINEAILCDKLPYCYIVNTNTTVGIRCLNSTAYGNFMIYVRLPAEYQATIKTREQFKAWLAENPLDVRYGRAEPIETPLSAQELASFAALHSNKPNTTVFNDGGAEVKLFYVADTKTYIDQKISAISAAMLM